jgi:hypothetical protein
VVKENFPCVECGKTYGTKASLRTHKYNQGQEHSWSWRWRVASYISSTPSGDSHMFSPGADLWTGGGLSLKSTKISYQKNYAKKYILGTSYLIIEIFICIPVWT